VCKLYRYSTVKLLIVCEKSLIYVAQLMWSMVESVIAFDDKLSETLRLIPNTHTMVYPFLGGNCDLVDFLKLRKVALCKAFTSMMSLVRFQFANIH